MLSTQHGKLKVEEVISAPRKPTGKTKLPRKTLQKNAYILLRRTRGLKQRIHTDMVRVACWGRQDSCWP